MSFYKPNFVNRQPDETDRRLALPHENVRKIGRRLNTVAP